VLSYSILVGAFGENGNEPSATRISSDGNESPNTFEATSIYL